MQAVEEMGSHATQFRKDVSRTVFRGFAWFSSHSDHSSLSDAFVQVQTGVGGLLKEHSQRLTGAVLEGLSSISKAAEANGDDSLDGKQENNDEMPPSVTTLGAVTKKAD